MIIGKPRMKKEMQQARVKSALCFLRYFGNSSDTEVTMVSMVANWGERTRKSCFVSRNVRRTPPSV